MRKIILEEWLSLDGFAAGKNGELDFFPSTEENKYSDQQQLLFLEEVDTMLLGRKTYELFVDFWPTASVETEIIADKLNSLNKIVLSNTLQTAPWGDWTEGQIISGNGVSAIKSLKVQEGKNIVLWGSISLAQTLIENNLIDEYRIQVCPTLVGAGRTLFPKLENSKNLRLAESRSYDSGVVFLKYEIR